ncbi:MAG: rhamnogalacturonan lyase [Dysgonamonadaceae bacterium]|jgi:rhamnogalacturonan endolyase|nr:rhamnogalacturonan lyase [Dysgonamonadaceae bacterium]
MKNIFLLLIALTHSVLLNSATQAEKLDRGLVAVNTENGVFLSWRLLGNEAPDLAFNIFKNGVLLNNHPLTGATCFLDSLASAEDTYLVKTASKADKTASKPVKPWIKPYLTIKMQRPEAQGMFQYLPNDCSVGDLDGDGEYEIVVKWNARARDNSHNGLTDNVFLDAYKLDGTRLWRIDLGCNIRAGAHYTQFMVYDLDGDGRAEIACKTAPGTIDGQGKAVILGNDDPKADYRDENGHILQGPEYLTVFNGLTGAEISTVPYEPPRGENPKTVWGDDRGNRSERYLACIAYLDGKHPSLVMCRGYYTRAVIAAWDFKKGKLKKRWVYDTGDSRDKLKTAYGQGNHSIAAADVDGDGRDEIIYGGAAIDDNGRLLYSTGLGHGDAHHLSDLDPDRPGLEFFDVHENRPSPAGVELRDARTGQLLFGRPTTIDVGRGLAADIDPRHRGFEFWSAASDSVYNIRGEVISTRKPSTNFRIYWDGDVQDELLDGTKITKWNGDGTDLLVDFRDFGASAINGTKNNPCLSADLFGDWREEAIYYNRENPDELMIFTTVIPSEIRMVTLMSDHIYRLGIAVQNVAYNQPPHLGRYIGK